MGLVSGLSLANHSDSESFLVAHTLLCQDGHQWKGFGEVVRHVASPFDLAWILDGGLLVLCSSPGPPVIKYLKQMVTVVPGQGGQFQSVFLLTFECVWKSSVTMLSVCVCECMWVCMYVSVHVCSMCACVCLSGLGQTLTCWDLWSQKVHSWAKSYCCIPVCWTMLRKYTFVALIFFFSLHLEILCSEVKLIFSESSSLLGNWKQEQNLLSPRTFPGPASKEGCSHDLYLHP